MPTAAPSCCESVQTKQRVGFFTVHIILFPWGSWGTKHAASYFPLRFEDLFLHICKAVETFPLLVKYMTWQEACELDPAIHYRQFSEILNFVLWGAEQHLKRWDWHYRKQMMARSSWTRPHVSTCPGTCHQMPKGKLRLFCEAAALAVPMLRLVVVP